MVRVIIALVACCCGCCDSLGGSSAIRKLSHGVWLWKGLELQQQKRSSHSVKEDNSKIVWRGSSDRSFVSRRLLGSNFCQFRQPGVIDIFE